MGLLHRVAFITGGRAVLLRGNGATGEAGIEDRDAGMEVRR